MQTIPSPPKISQEQRAMSDQVDELKGDVLAVVGKWALAILGSMLVLGFAAGAWATKQELRTTNLESTVDQLIQDRKQNQEEWRRWRDGVNSKIDTQTATLNIILEQVKK